MDVRKILCSSQIVVATSLHSVVCTDTVHQNILEFLVMSGFLSWWDSVVRTDQTNKNTDKSFIWARNNISEWHQTSKIPDQQLGSNTCRFELMPMQAQNERRCHITTGDSGQSLMLVSFANDARWISSSSPSLIWFKWFKHNCYPAKNKHDNRKMTIWRCISH